MAKFKALEKSMYSKMVGFTGPAASPPVSEDSQEGTDEEVRKQFVRELTLLRDRPGVTQVVLPHTLSSEQLGTARLVAEELGLLTEKVVIHTHTAGQSAEANVSCPPH